MKPKRAVYDTLLEGIDAIIFDLDGTLFASMMLWLDIDREYLQRYGYEVPDDLSKSIEGYAFHDVAIHFKERFRLTDSVEQIEAVWNEMAYEQYRYRISFKPGVPEFLQKVKDAGFPLGIATSNSRYLLDAALTGHGLSDTFSSICTAEQVIKGKPDPSCYLIAAKGLGIPPDRCLVFEDLVLGIEAGNRAGMRTCAVWDIFSDDQWEEKKQAADYYIDSFEELL